MKNFKLLLVLLITISLNSCNSDDDLPAVELPPTNVFCYGDGTQEFNVTGAFRGETLEIATDQIRTQVTILGDGLTLDDMDEIDGTGPIILLDFYGDNTAGFQTGLYEISTLQESANVSGSFSIDFDPTITTNNFATLDDGLIQVSPFNNGYLIEIDATDENGDDFHGNYFGIVPIIQ